MCVCESFIKISVQRLQIVPAAWQGYVFQIVWLVYAAFPPAPQKSCHMVRKQYGFVSVSPAFLTAVLYLFSSVRIGQSLLSVSFSFVSGYRYVIS